MTNRPLSHGCGELEAANYKLCIFIFHFKILDVKILDPPLPDKPTPTSYGFLTVLLEPINALRGGGRHCET